jgi:hypothetical protein
MDEFEVKIMSVQELQSDLLMDLSTEEQQDVSGGFGFGGYGGYGRGVGRGFGGYGGVGRGFGGYGGVGRGWVARGFAGRGLWF